MQSRTDYHPLHVVLFLAITLWLMSAGVALHAESRINLGDMQLDVNYTLSAYKNYIGRFTAPRSGVVTAEANSVDVLYPYREELDNMMEEGNAIEYTFNNLWGNRSYDFTVEEGVTYVMYAPFIMTDQTVFHMTMAEETCISLKDCIPAAGSTFHISNGGQILVSFDKSVAFSEATLSSGDTSETILGRVNVGNIGFDVKDLVWQWYEEGKVQEGNRLTLTLQGICMANQPEVLYNSDGRCEISFVLGPKPICVTGSQNTSGELLSYYRQSDESGVVTIHFSGPIGSGSAVLRCGNTESEGGTFYNEELPVSIQGNDLTVDLRGKRRKSSDLNASGVRYEEISLGIIGVCDTYGNFAISTIPGNLGSYWYTYQLKEVSLAVTAEFNPASGSRLDDYQELQISIGDEPSLSYSGISFTYTDEAGIEQETIVSDVMKEPAEDNPTTSILTVTLPEAVKTGHDVKVCLEHLEAADGMDYAELLSAEYNTGGSSIASLPVSHATGRQTDLAGRELKAATAPHGFVISHRAIRWYK